MRLISSPLWCFFLINIDARWKPFDSARNWPDLGPRFAAGERVARATTSTPAGHATASAGHASASADRQPPEAEFEDKIEDDQRDLGWATVLKRTFEAYIRGEHPNMYGEWIKW